MECVFSSLPCDEIPRGGQKPAAGYLGNHADIDTKCTPGSGRGAFYSARGAFSVGGVQNLSEIATAYKGIFLLFLFISFSRRENSFDLTA